MASNSGLLRRLEKLEHAIRLHRARFIVIEIDGVQEEEGATAALLKALDVKSDDLAVEIRRRNPRFCYPPVTLAGSLAARAAETKHFSVKWHTTHNNVF
jgi:hypothetical protein